MSDLLGIEVVKKSGKSVTFRLRIAHPDQLHFPYSLSFAEMLIGEPAELGSGDRVAWTEKEEEQGRDVHYVVRTALTDVSRMPEPGADYEGCEATLRVEVDTTKCISKLKVGQCWRSTAYETEEQDHPYWVTLKEPPFVQGRVKKAKPRPQERGLRYLESSFAGFTMEVASNHELPAATPDAFLKVVRYSFPALDEIQYWRHPPSRFIERVEVQAVGGDIDRAKGRIRIANDSSLRGEGAAWARYRVVAAAPRSSLDRWPNFRCASTWLREPPRPGNTMGAGEPALGAAPPPSAAGDVELFEELVELCEDLEDRLSTLADGLRGGGDIVLRALTLVGNLGEDAAPLCPRVGELTGNADVEVALKALETAERLGLATLAPYVALAVHRDDARVAASANKVLAALPRPEGFVFERESAKIHWAPPGSEV